MTNRGIGLKILTGGCVGVHRPDDAGLADRLLFAVTALSAAMERKPIRERTIARARLARAESVTAIAAYLGVGRSTLDRALQHDASVPA